MSAGPSKATAKSGYVQGLNNYVQGTRQKTSDIRYTFVEGAGDQFTATVTLPDKTWHTGTAVGKQAAKEEAAYTALKALRQIR